MKAENNSITQFVINHLYNFKIIHLKKHGYQHGQNATVKSYLHKTFSFYIHGKIKQLKIYFYVNAHHNLRIVLKYEIKQIRFTIL